MMTIAPPLSASLMTMSPLVFNCCNAFFSALNRLFLGVSYLMFNFETSLIISSNFSSLPAEGLKSDLL